MNIFSTKGKTIIITGGSGYLGFEMTKAFLEAGAKVVIADIVKKDLPKNIVSDEQRRNFFSLICDISSTDSIKQLFIEAVELCGKIDVLINCGFYGAGYGKESLIQGMSDDVWEKGLDGAVGTAFRCIREVIPYMIKSGGGSIINFGSMYGLVSPDFRIYGDNPSKNPPNYGAGKAAVIQLTKYAAAQLAQNNIRVNCISPGPFPSPKNKEDESFTKKLADKTMLGRVGSADEIVGPIMLLASDASSYMTGSNIVVDGGWTAW